MSKKPKLRLAGELSPEAQARLEQLTGKAKSKNKSTLARTVDALQRIAKTADQKMDAQKDDVLQVSKEQETFNRSGAMAVLAHNINNLGALVQAEKLQPTEFAKNNKIVKPKLTTEELDRKKQEQLVIDRKVQQYRKQIQALSALYPKCFTANPKPLAIGLDKEIIANESLKPEVERISKTSIKRFLGAYTSKYKYLQNCTLGAARIDLEGNEVGLLDQEAVEFAKEKLANCKVWQNKCNAWKQAISKAKNQNNAWEKAINKIKLKTKETK